MGSMEENQSHHKTAKIRLPAWEETIQKGFNFQDNIAYKVQRDNKLLKKRIEKTDETY